MKVGFNSFLFCSLSIAVLLITFPTHLYAQIKTTPMYGGNQGNDFETTCQSVVEIQVKTGVWLEGIKVFCDRALAANEKGNLISTIHRFELDPDENLIEVKGTLSGSQIASVESIQFITNKRQSPEYGKKKGREPFSIVIPEGYRFLGFYGRSSLSLNGIGVVMEEFGEKKPQSEIFGGKSGNPFQAILPSVTEIQIRAGDWIDGISILNAKGESKSFGGNGGSLQRFILQAQERITRVSLSFDGKGGNYIHNLQIHTNLRNSPVYGKLTGKQKKEIQVPAGFLITGFTGRVGKYIDALGLVYEPEPPAPIKPVPAMIQHPIQFQPKPNEVLDNACTEGRDKLEWMFAWEFKTGATLYHLQVFDTKQNLILNEQALTSPTFVYSQALPVEQSMLYNWSWQIRAQIGGEWSVWSPKSFFSIEPPNNDCGNNPSEPSAPITQGLPTTGKPIFQQPVPSPAITSLFPLANSVLDNGCNNREDPMDWFFQWNPTDNAAIYHFEVYREGEPPTISETKLHSNFFSFNTTGFVDNQKLSNWHWRVRAQINGSWSAWVDHPFSLEGNNNDCSPSNPKAKSREMIFIDNQTSNSVEAVIEYNQGNLLKKLHLRDFNTKKKHSLKLPRDAASVQVNVFYLDNGIWKSLGQQTIDDSEYSQCFILRYSPNLNGVPSLVLDRLYGEYCK
ncbi:MAG: jacalin-like lectin [Chloroherpetonaceae bacterium]|nr:jacalin-like lectin [Chloroherpetonaceae bacterium]